MTPPARLSALHHLHLRLGARMVDRAGWQQPWAFNDQPQREAELVRQSVGVLDLSPLGKLAVKGVQQQLDKLLADAWSNANAHPLRARRVGSSGPIICRLTPEEALVLTLPEARESTFSQLEGLAARATDGCAHVLDLTSGQTGLRIAGPSARDLLRTCTALDLRAAAFPNLSLAQTAFARVTALVVRDDLADLPAFSVFFPRDYTQHVWEWLFEVGATYRLAPIGLGALEALEAVHA